MICAVPFFVQGAKEYDGNHLRNLTNTAWSFASLGFRNKHLMEQIASAVLKMSTELIPQELANLAWCCAKTGFVDADFLEAISRQSIKIIGEFVTQDPSFEIESTAEMLQDVLSLLLYCLSELSCKLSQQEKKSEAEIPEGPPPPRTLAVKDTVSNSQDLSNTVWACGTLLEANPPLLAAVSHQSVLKLHLFLKLCVNKQVLNFEQLTCFTSFACLLQFATGLEAEGHVYEFGVSTKEPRAVQHSLGVFKAIHGRNATQAWTLPKSDQSNQSLDVELTFTIL